MKVGPLSVALNHAQIWEPRPDWDQLRQHREQIESRLSLVRDLALRQAPPDSLPDLTGLPTFRRLKPVRSDWVEQIAGLGSGLTPAGDDFLMGVILWTWLTHPQPDPFCRQIVQVAAPRTTTLSAALLRAAARGECSAAWHALLVALDTGNDDQLASAVRQVLAYGHTSGADTLAGFLWMPTQDR